MPCCNMYRRNKNTIALARFRRTSATCCADMVLISTSGLPAVLHLPAMLTMQAGRCRRVCLGLKPIVQLNPPKAFGVVYSDIRIPEAMPQAAMGCVKSADGFCDC